MRKKIVAGNWKMNLTQSDTTILMNGLNEYLKNNPLREDLEVMVAPGFIFLNEIKNNTEHIKVIAQNCSNHEKGAYTGEISVMQLKSINCDGVIIGHSERRAYYNESNRILKSKIDRALSAELSVIYCCGESLEERNEGVHFDTIKSQIEECLYHLNHDDFSDLVIAYEPIWAIGTGVTASDEQAQEMHQFIRSLIADKFGEVIGESVSILYGGSVKPGNAKSLFSQNDIDGGLVGGASLNASDFVEIIKAI